MFIIFAHEIQNKMLISQRDSLLVIILLSSVMLILITACVLVALKFRQYRSRPYLFSCCFLLFQCIGVGGILLRSILNGRVNAHFDAVLRPISLTTGFFTLFCLLAYIVEIKYPGKLTLKKLAAGISPVLIVSILLALIHPSALHYPKEIVSNIQNPDIWLRLIMVLFYIVYPVTVACQPYEWNKCLVSKKIITGLHIFSCLLSPAFIAGLVCGYFPAVLFNYVLALVIDTLVLYIELKIRIPISEPIRDTALKKQSGYSILHSPQIWMNPDMTATQLARIMGTNHTYLLNMIKGFGYSNYSDMINRKRVEHICKELEKGTDADIITLMFEAGFRSRSTASREFKRIVGCSPSEYQESISHKPKSGPSKL